MPDRPDPRPDSGRYLVLVAAVVVVCAGIGFMTGTQESRYRALDPPQPGPRPTDVQGIAQPARTHAELAVRPWRGGRRSEFGRAWPGSVLPKAPAPGDAGPAADRVLIQNSLVERSSNRAFDGAPPTIPHPVRQGSACNGFRSRVSFCSASAVRVRPVN